MKKAKAAIFLSMTSVACRAEPIGIGFIEPTPTEEANEVILYSSQKLDSTSTVDFEYKLPSGKTKCCHRVYGNLFKKENITETGSSAKKVADTYAYTALIKSLPPQSLNGIISTAVINSDSTEEISPNLIKAKKNDDEFTVESCYGIEGINLYRKQNGTLVEHFYFYFNYDIEPTCPSAMDLNPPPPG